MERSNLGAVSTSSALKKVQPLIAIGVLALISIFINIKYAGNSKLALFMITGLMLGYVLQRSRFGFAGGIKKTAMTGSGSLAKALLMLFGLTMVGTAGIQFAAAQKGAQVAFKAAEGMATIPGTGSVSAINIAFVIGGVLFGIGMVIGGGCASGTLSDVGEGSARALIVLFFFCVGGMLGTWNLPALKKTVLFASGKTVYLPDMFGYVGALLISLAILTLIYAFVKYYESKRKKNGTLIVDEIPEDEKPLEEANDYNFLSWNTYHKFFVERWSYKQSAVLLTILALFIIITTGSSWGASGPYTHWGVALFSKLGIDFASIEGFAGSVKVVNGGILNDPVSVRNIGIILGALICMLLAGKWKFNMNFKAKHIAFYGLGGLLMGYGAKLAGGCNVGALFSGIVNFSLSGWVFLLALVAGGLVGVMLVKKFKISA